MKFDDIKKEIILPLSDKDIEILSTFEMVKLFENIKIDYVKDKEFVEYLDNKLNRLIDLNNNSNRIILYRKDLPICKMPCLDIKESHEFIDAIISKLTNILTLGKE